MENDIRAVRLKHTASLFTKICDGLYIGPQGPHLSEFLEEACELQMLTKCNLEIYRSHYTRLKKFQEYFMIKHHHESAEATAKERFMNSLTDSLVLTPEGITYMNSGKYANEIVYKLILRCGGGSYRGKISGSNCIRVSSRPGWCRGVGDCTEECFYKTSGNSKLKLEHMCNFTVSIEANLQDIREGRRRIRIQGDHGYPKSEDWIPPNKLRPPTHFREKAVKVGTTVKGPSASNILSFINSPTGPTSRSYMKRNDYYKTVENHRRAQIIKGSGPYNRIDNAIRSLVHPSTNKFASEGHPYVIHYRGGVNAETMQITIVTNESLLNLLHLGMERVVSDSRWIGGLYCKTCVTSMLAVDPELKYGVVCGIQFSSSESADTKSIYIDALRRVIPCGDDCSHTLEITNFDDGSGYYVSRECANEVAFNPRLIIDKDSAAKLGSLNAGCSVGVDDFHHHQSFSENLKERGVFVSSAVAAGVDRLHRLRLRAKTQAAVDKVIDEIIRFISSCGFEEAIDEIKRYVKSALGYTGSPWEGCIGDIARIPNHPCRNNSTQCAEGHNFACQYCLNSGRAEGRIDYAILEKTLGITAMGNRTAELTYFKFFTESYRERKSMAQRQPRKVLSVREKRSKYEGSFIAWRAILDTEAKFVVKYDRGGKHWFVKKGLPRILGGYLPAEALRQNAEAFIEVDRDCASFDFNIAISAILPEDLPTKPGYYTVHIPTLSCYLCEFWVYNGSGTVKCKHIHAAEIIKAYRRLVRHGGDVDKFITELEDDLCTYIKNRERSKRRGVQRDEVFLLGTNKEILQYLKAGAVSVLEPSSAGAPVISSTEFSVALAEIVELQKNIYNRRIEMKTLEVGDNTCRICGGDDGVGEPWVGCDHLPYCLGGAGWYHCSCVSMSYTETTEGAWICPLCQEDDDAALKLETLLDRSRNCRNKSLDSTAVSQSQRTIITRSDIISDNCTIIDGVVRFLKAPTAISREFLDLDMQLHDRISDLAVEDGITFTPYDGNVCDFEEGERISFTLSRDLIHSIAPRTSREVLSQSSDGRTVGCGRDTYNCQELPSWLATDTARPADVQKPQTKGRRIGKYSNPNARVVRGTKRKRLSDSSLTASKTMLQMLYNSRKKGSRCNSYKSNTK